MGLFRKKKMDYGYYSSYSSKRRRLRVDRAALAVIAGILLVVGIVVYFNFNRIQFLVKGFYLPILLLYFLQPHFLCYICIRKNNRNDDKLCSYRL